MLRVKQKLKSAARLPSGTRGKLQGQLDALLASIPSDLREVLLLTKDNDLCYEADTTCHQSTETAGTAAAVEGETAIADEESDIEPIETRTTAGADFDEFIGNSMTVGPSENNNASANVTSDNNNSVPLSDKRSEAACSSQCGKNIHNSNMCDAPYAGTAATNRIGDCTDQINPDSALTIDVSRLRLGQLISNVSSSNRDKQDERNVPASSNNNSLGVCVSDKQETNENHILSSVKLCPSHRDCTLSDHSSCNITHSTADDNRNVTIAHIKDTDVNSSSSSNSRMPESYTDQEQT